MLVVILWIQLTYCIEISGYWTLYFIGANKIKITPSPFTVLYCSTIFLNIVLRIVAHKKTGQTSIISSSNKVAIGLSQQQHWGHDARQHCCNSMMAFISKLGIFENIWLYFWSRGFDQVKLSWTCYETKKKVLLLCCRNNIFNKNMPLSSLGVTTLLWQLETFPRQYWGTLLRSRRYEGARARWSWRKPNEYKRTFYLPTYTCYATYMHPTPNYALMLLSMFAKIYTFCTLHIIS